MSELNKFIPSIPSSGIDDAQKHNQLDDDAIRAKLALIESSVGDLEKDSLDVDISFGDPMDKFAQGSRSMIENMLNSENRMIIKRVNSPDHWNFKIIHAPIPKEMTNCNKEACLTTDEIKKLNQWFLSPFWDTKVTMRMEKTPGTKDKQRRVYDRDIDISAKDVLHSSLNFDAPEYINSGYYSRFYKLNSLGIGQPARPGKETHINAEKKRLLAFGVLDQAFLEGEKKYQENNPLIHNFLSLIIEEGAETKTVDFVPNSEQLDSYLDSNNLSDEEKLIIIRDISRGLNLLHKKRKVKVGKDNKLESWITEGDKVLDDEQVPEKDDDAYEDHWVTHGDLHSGNILVVKDDQGKVIGVKIIDYSLVSLDEVKRTDLSKMEYLMRLVGFPLVNDDCYEIARDLKLPFIDLSAKSVVVRVEEVLDRVFNIKS